MRRSLAIAVATQGAGTALALVTTLAIAHLLGPAAQGSFAIFKNWFELVSSTLLLGMPQGLVYAINKRAIAPGWAKRMSLRYAAAALPIAALATWVATLVHYLGGNASWMLGLIVAIGCSGYMYHGLARSILLTDRDGLAFSILTTAPNVGIAIIVAVQTIVGAPRFDLTFCINGVLCASLAMLALRGVAGGSAPLDGGWLRQFTSQSGHALLQSLIVTVQPLLLFYLLKRSEGGIAQVGLFSFALIILTAISAFASMISPILFNRWSRVADQAAVFGKRGQVLMICGATGGAATIAVIVGTYFFAGLAGIEYAAAIPASLTLAFACAPLLFSRVWTSALMAVDRAMAVTTAGLARVATMLVTYWLASLMAVPALSAAAIAWLAAEWSAAAIMLAVGGPLAQEREAASMVT